MTEWLQRVPAVYDGPLTLEADACVIGTGAGGAVVASELAEAGWRVIMLERGGHHTRQDFTQREREMMPLLFEDGGARATRDGAITVLHGRTVGGSTTVNWAICFDPPAAVLDGWADVHEIQAIRAADLAPSLARVRRVLDVQPIPEGMVPRNGALLRDGARKLGLRGEVFEHSRSSCPGSGFCMLGCAYDRKQSMLVTYVPRAMHFGARLVPMAEATGLVRAGDRIREVLGHVTDAASGRTFPLRVQAPVIVVAGGAIGTPELLLKSELPGLGTRVGHNLRLHPTTAAVAIFDEPVRGAEGIHFTTYVPDLEPEGILLESVFAYPGLMGANLFSWGPDARELMSHYDHLAAGIVLLHDESAGRVTLDGRGIPVLDYQLSSRDHARMRKGLATLARIYLAMGAREVVIPHQTGLRIRSEADVGRIMGLDLGPDRLAMFSAHQMGTARMGSDLSYSVTDSWGRVHAYRNLFVADASLFPTSLGVNPQLTVATLGDRLGRYLVEKKFKELT